MNTKLIVNMWICFIITWIFILGTVTVIWDKAFKAGVEWERNIILEYAYPNLECEDSCELS